jgi:hypothetical protein
MQGSNLRPSGCKASEPERCATESAPLSENAEVIIWKSPAANETPFPSCDLPLAALVLDRPLQQATAVPVKGQSYRLKEKGRSRVFRLREA